ncbi:MAG: NAD(P)H-dependent oxidoreductase, partial [Methanocorpusculum sp.]|nr:NAD(P)H-dependent oxidoreductase [Methanocorpusculum sp.]
DELATADAVVFGLPIYFGRANAPFLMMIDRLYAMIGTGLSTRLPAGKKFTVAITSGGGGLEIISPIYDSIVDIFGTYFHWETCGLIWQNGMHEKNEIKKHADKLSEAKALGKSLVK